MSNILERLFQGFVQWLYSLCVEMVLYVMNALLDVFKMDLTYFRQAVPVTDSILQIVLAAGWALLLGNLVFQAARGMLAGLGFEGEDPKVLFLRTAVFSFLLLASQQICALGLGISAQVIALLEVPSVILLKFPEESSFSIGASWLLVVIIGVIVMWQVIKLFFEIAERYVVTAVLVILSPLAFAMGGSKQTEDIFRGWCRMFASMCVMMVMSVVFLKLLLSAMWSPPTGVALLPWMLLVVAIARVARKIDSIIARIGLNPAITGDGLGRGLPGMAAYAVIRGMGHRILQTAGRSGMGRSPSGGRGAPSSAPRTPPPIAPPPAGTPPTGPAPQGTAAASGGQRGAGPGTAPPPQPNGVERSPGTAAPGDPVVHNGMETYGISAGQPLQGQAPQPGPGPRDGSSPLSFSLGQAARRSSVPSAARSPADQGGYGPRGINTTRIARTEPAANRPKPPAQDVHRPPQASPCAGGAQIPRDSHSRAAREDRRPRILSTQQQTASYTESTPIYQEGTPRIPPPPGVAGTLRGARAGEPAPCFPVSPPAGYPSRPSAPPTGREVPPDTTARIRPGELARPPGESSAGSQRQGHGPPTGGDRPGSGIPPQARRHSVPGQAESRTAPPGQGETRRPAPSAQTGTGHPAPAEGRSPTGRQPATVPPVEAPPTGAVRQSGEHRPPAGTQPLTPGAGSVGQSRSTPHAAPSPPASTPPPARPGGSSTGGVTGRAARPDRPGPHPNGPAGPRPPAPANRPPVPGASPSGTQRYPRGGERHEPKL